MKTNISLPLGLPEFKILKQTIQEKRILLEVETKQPPNRCIYCGFKDLKQHDKRVRKVRDMDLLDKHLYLFIHMKRWYCNSCNEIFSESLESIPPGCHQTNRLRIHIFKQCRDNTISNVSRQLAMSYKTIERVYYKIAKQQLQETPISGVIGIDEIAVRKGHHYETVVTDILTGTVHEMGANRDYKSALHILEKFQHKGVETLVMDMWRPFHKAAKELFPGTPIVIDKYHVVQKVNLAFEQVRKKYSMQITGLKRGRFALLKRPFRLTEKQNKKLEEYHTKSPEIAYAYYLKELFYDLYEQPDYDKANEFLDSWIKNAKDSPFTHFHEFSKTLESWKINILEYFRLPYTNAKTEGINHKIKNRKRMSYGFRNQEHFRIRVKLECSGSKREIKPSSLVQSIVDIA